MGIVDKPFIMSIGNPKKRRELVKPDPLAGLAVPRHESAPEASTVPRRKFGRHDFTVSSVCLLSL